VFARPGANGSDLAWTNFKPRYENEYDLRADFFSLISQLNAHKPRSVVKRSREKCLRPRALRPHASMRGNDLS
jgi:hypothetical protein